MIVEICCGSYYDAKQASEGGADRIELNSALHLGGLTPSISALRLTKQFTPLKVITMVRPRGGGFCYCPEDLQIMDEDARLLLENGADGIAFGFLTETRQINTEHTKRMLSLIKEAGKEAVFHRAFDCVTDPFSSIETLIRLGVDRVLTSGLKSTAIEGASLLKRLQKDYGQQIQILPGSGLRASNAAAFLQETALTQIHSSCRDWITDPTTSSDFVSYAFASAPHQNDYDVVSKEETQKLVSAVKVNSTRT